MTAHALSAAARPAVSPRLRADVSDWLLTFSASALAVTVCLLLSDELHHWFVIPVILCGGLIGLDALDWLRGRVDAFDPVGVTGVIGVHFFFAAPLLHVLTGYWMPYITPPEDWRPWLGYMAWINVAGLLIYRMSRTWLAQAWPATPTRSVWRLDPKRFPLVCGAALLVATCLQLHIYSTLGGISGYIEAFTDTPENFAGMGYLFIISESVPILFVIVAAMWANKQASRRTWLMVVGVLFAFLALKLLFGGLRGSRGHIIYGMFWVLGILHYMIRPLPKKLFLVGASVGLLFMYAYGFYKEHGSNAVNALQGADVRAEMTDVSHRTFSYVLLGDLARADVQSFLLYRLSPECRDSHYRYVFGETYFAAVSLVIPKSLLPERPLDKTFVGAEALFGRRVPISRQAATLAFIGDGWDFVATYSYGVAGEAMLNFGLVGALFSFVPLAFVTVWASRWGRRLDKDDVRVYLAPFVATLSFMTLMWDSDILVFYTLKETFVAAAVLFFGSRRELRSARHVPELAA